MNSIRGKKHRISPVGEGRVLLAGDGESEIFFCRRRRGNQFKRGVMTHVDQLAREYHLDQIDIVPGGVFIDCGANIGELGIWARGQELDYIAFEPEGLEAYCCDLNNFDGRTETRREALWKETSIISLYSKPESGDSSLIDMGGATRTRIQAVALDGAVNLSDTSGTVILKIEAEGAEPEVLEGAASTLTSVNWVAIDCGHERGVSKAHTFVETNVFMHAGSWFSVCIARSSTVSRLSIEIRDVDRMGHLIQADLVRESWGERPDLDWEHAGPKSRPKWFRSGIAMASPCAPSSVPQPGWCGTIPCQATKSWRSSIPMNTASCTREPNIRAAARSCAISAG